ncbi:MAG: HU family DNA-binding protein [Egibacteraceae bacterium]
MRRQSGQRIGQRRGSRHRDDGRRARERRTATRRPDPDADDPAPSTEESTVNKSELVEAAADKAELSKKDVATALDAVLDTITETVARGDKVALSGFGTFDRRERAARTARNPQTGEQMRVEASKNPGFKPGTAFKDAVNK